MSDPKSETATRSRRSSAFADNDDDPTTTTPPSTPFTPDVTGTDSPDVHSGQPEPDYDDEEVVEEPDFSDQGDGHPVSPADVDDTVEVAFGTEPDDPDDPFLVDIDSSPPPRGLPSLRGVDARTLQAIEDFAGDTGDTPPNESATRSFWNADDLVLSGVPATETVGVPSFVDSDPHDLDGTDEGSLVDDVSSEEPLSGEFPTAATASYSYPGDQGDQEEFATSDDDGGTDESGPDHLTEDDYRDDFDTGDDDIDTYREIGVEEYDDDTLNPDDCVTVDSYADAPEDLRSRSRKRKSRRAKGKADRADSKLRGDERRKPLSTKAVLAVLAVVALGVLAFRLLGGNGEEQQAGSPAITTAPPAGTSTSTTTAPRCMTSPESVGVPVACDAEGDQSTGTNAILAYDHAFYGTRNADKVYSLTAKGSQGATDAMSDKRKLQQAINGTPCGSTYVLTITPREIGKTYDVVVMVRSPKGDPLPAADGTCPTNIPAMDDANPGTTRTLKQTITVSGAPGSYVVTAIDTHR